MAFKGWNMLVLETEDTKGVSVVANTFVSKEVLTGHNDGKIHLWRLTVVIRSYIKDTSSILYINVLDKEQFISVSTDGHARIWCIENSCVKKWFYLPWERADYFVILPNDLLAFSKFTPRGIETIQVWDIYTGNCVHEEFQNCFIARGMPLAVTTSGLLVAASCCNGNMCIWKVTKSECSLVCRTEIDRIYSLAALPTDEIVTAAHDIIIYKFTQYGEIYKRKVIEHRNVIDIIIPVGGYKFLTVDRSRNHSGVLKMWYYKSEKYDYLGHCKNIGLPRLVLSRHDVIFAAKDNKLFIKHYNSGVLQFSRCLAEIRKNVRILAQAERTSSSHFIKLPIEIQIKIALMTVSNMNENEEKVSEEFAWSHFCRPHYSEHFFRNDERTVCLKSY